jgi:hypothetical protein
MEIEYLPAKRDTTFAERESLDTARAAEVFDGATP